jgi:hypothetical protein
MMLGVWLSLSCHPSSCDPYDVWFNHQHLSETKTGSKKERCHMENANPLYAAVEFWGQYPCPISDCQHNVVTRHHFEIAEFCRIRMGQWHLMFLMVLLKTVAC